MQLPQLINLPPGFKPIGPGGTYIIEQAGHRYVGAVVEEPVYDGAADRFLRPEIGKRFEVYKIGAETSDAIGLDMIFVAQILLGDEQ